jgi:hypothetical protein
MFVDYAGGYCIFTRLMRDLGFDYYWCDLYAKNIFAQGFAYIPERTQVHLITAFECFEHFVDPCAEIEAMLAMSPHILFTTDFLPSPLPAPDAWWYYACNQGQHVSFYRPKTCEYLAQRYNLFFYTHWGMHFLTRERINPLRFRLLVEWANRGLFSFVKRSMKSRTVEDRNVCLHEKNTVDTP